MGGSSRVDDEGFIEIKKKKSCEEVSPKTDPFVGKKNVSTPGNSLKTACKKNASTSGNGIFSLSNSFEALNVNNPVTEEVNKVSTSGVQEEGQISNPRVEKINMFEKQLMEGKCVLLDDEGNPKEMVDYSG
ncbi:hypothetical protein Tco_1420180 [Tanacetum coccineum]